MMKRKIVTILATLGVVGAASFVSVPMTQAAGVVTLAPTADTYVQKDKPTENFGTSVRWSAEGRTSIKRDSLLKFDVPVPAGEHVTSAKLRAYSEASTTATEFVDVYTTSDAWSETGVNWNNAPARNTWITKQGNFANGAWVEWDVTSGVAATGGVTNFKLETNAQKWVGFKSDENTTASLRPVLVVTTEVDSTPPPPPPPPTVTKVNDTEFTYTGTWYTGPAAGALQEDNHHANATDAAFTLTFTGTQAQLYGERNAAMGIIAVSLDNGPETLVDSYAATRSEQNLLYTSAVVADGSHTLKVRNTGTKNAASGGVWISADRIDVTGTVTAPPPVVDGQPKNVRPDPAYQITTSSFRALWDSPPGYTGQYKHYLNEVYVSGADDSTTGETFSGLAAGTTYGLRVSATIDGVEYKSDSVNFTTASDAPPPPADTQAAVVHNWGPIVTGDEFNYVGAPDAAKWSVYNSPGHAGNGIRSPQQVTIDGSKMVMNGTPEGTTAGMSAKFANQKYGRWEVRAAGSGDDEYHMVSILWPDSGNWPCDGEIDYAETTGDWNVIKFFHHYSCSNSQTSASMALDVTQFHNYAVDWSPTGIVGYVDGVKWFEDNTPSHQPPGPMHQTLQLDWFPDSTANGAGEMRVDWVRVYAASGTTPPPPPPPPTGDSFDIVTVGDINPSGHSAASTESGKNAASVKSALDSGVADYFLGLGDFQYSIGHCGLSPVSNPSNDHFSKYHTQWGSFKNKTYWTAAPNHDYQPGRNDDLAQYMDGQCVDTVKSATSTDPTRQGPNPAGTFQRDENWYSFDKGNWHVLIAPSALWRYDTTKARAITSEMDANLAAAKAAGKHLAVVYHEPYFTSATSSHNRASDHKPWIDVFHKNGVRVLLSGSQHNYERSCIVNNADQCNVAGATMQQFQVSTGGISLRSFTDSPAYIQKRFTGTWGNLRMSLKADGSYTWNFVPTSGNMANSDSGSRAANQ